MILSKFSYRPLLGALLLLVPGLLGSGLSASPEQATPVPRLSFDGLEENPTEQVAVLGTFFRAGKEDHINFIPVEPKTKGVWTRYLTPEARKQALERIERQQHVPGIAICDVSTTTTDAPKRPPGVTTGTYYGPIHTATVTKITFLTKEEATKMATILIHDPALRSRFIKRLQ